MEPPVQFALRLRWALGALRAAGRALRWSRSGSLALLLMLAGLPVAQASDLPPPMADALREHGIPEDAVALMVAPVSPLGRQWRHQVDKPMQPGSTMKLVTSVVALDRLGPNHRGFTELLSTVPIEGPVLAGSVVLRGGADPELGLPQLLVLLSELRWRGVQEIAGDIVLDRSLFRPARLELGVPPFDESPEFAYNVIPDALLVNGGLMGLELAADAQQLQARVWPPLPGISVSTHELQLNDLACGDWDDEWRTPRVFPGEAPGSWQIVLQGRFPRQCQRRVSLALLERNLMLERQLRLVWEGLGGRWSGTVRDDVAPPGALLVVRRDGRPWGELLRPLNK